MPGMLSGSQIETLRIALALGIGLYLAYVIVRRALLSDVDPTLRYSTDNAGGSMSVLLSGTKVTMMLTGLLALITWPLVLNSTPFAVLLIAANVGHYIIEKREQTMSGA